jgi:hypothetical protein
VAGKTFRRDRAGHGSLADSPVRLPAPTDSGYSCTCLRVDRRLCRADGFTCRTRC